MSEALLSIPQISGSAGNINVAGGTISINLKPGGSNTTLQTNLGSEIIFATLVYDYQSPSASFAMSVVPGQNINLNYSWAPGSSANAYLRASISGTYLVFTASGSVGIPAFESTIMYAAIVK